MARQPLRLVDGTAAQVAAYTGPAREPVFNRTTGTTHIQDGATPGGIPQVAAPHIDVVRSEIATRAIPLRSFVCGGFYALGDAGAAARYVRGTAAGPMAVQDAAGTWFQLDLSGPVIPAGWWGVVAGDPNKAAQNGIGINAAMAALAALNGGVLQLPVGDVWTDRTLDNRFSYVLVRGYGIRSSHDTSTSATPSGTRVIPVGGAFEVLRHRTPLPAERGVPATQNWRTIGGGFVDLTVIGNGVAPRLLHVTSVNLGTYRLYAENAVAPGTEAVLFDTLADDRASPQQMGEASDTQRNAIEMEIRQDPGAGTGGVDCVNFGGTVNSGNTSLNYGIKLKVRHANGVGVRFSNADNMDFEYINAQQVAGSGPDILVQAAPAGVSVGGINVRNLSAKGPSVVENLTDRAGAVSVGDLRIHHFDGGNGTPLPTGPNVIIENFNYPNYNMAYGKSFVGLSLGENEGTNKYAQDWLKGHPSFTAVIANSANSGLAWITPGMSDFFFQRVNPGTGTFQLFGPGAYEFATSVRVYGSVGFNGSAPVGKSSLSAALPTDGTATNAAIATALNAVRSCLVTVGLAQ